MIEFPFVMLYNFPAAMLKNDSLTLVVNEYTLVQGDFNGRV